MNTKKQYEVNHIEQTITFTKKFIRAAGVLGSSEYRIFRQLRAENPNYIIKEREIKKADKKQSYANLTYQNMREYITGVEGANASTVLDELETVIMLSKCQPGRYAYVKTWFLSRYPNYKSVNVVVESLSSAANAA